jgi:ADP-ribose pyrophosphatase YjhB (NUDIX family)
VSYKPSDFFVGVIDLFAVLLPGAVVAALARPLLTAYVFASGGFFPPLADPTQGWIAFAIGAYLIGSLLFLIGAFLDPLLYDPLRTVTVPPAKDGLFQQATAIKKRVLPRESFEPLNTFQWARATLRLRAPAAVGEIERYEADSKFFRSLAVSVYALLVIGVARHGTEPSDFNVVTLLAVLFVPVWLAVAKFVRDSEARRVAAHPKAAALRGKSIRRDLLIVGAALLLVVGLTTTRQDWRSVSLVVIFALSTWRYAERRWKSTKLAYGYSIILYDQDPPPEAARPGGAPHVMPDSGEADTRIHRGRQHLSMTPGSVVTQAGAIAVRSEKGRWHVLLVRALKDPSVWIFPKGHVEGEETLEATALRELREEAGYQGRVVAPVGGSEFASGSEIVCVQYFLVLISPGAKAVASEDREQRWCTTEEAAALLSFADARELLAKAETQMKRLIDV